jgi:hypothetical protein
MVIAQMLWRRAACCTAKESEFDSRHWQEIFLFIASRSILRHIQMVAGALSSRLKRSKREPEHSAPYSAEVKNAWSYTATPP